MAAIRAQQAEAGRDKEDSRVAEIEDRMGKDSSMNKKRRRSPEILIESESDSDEYEDGGERPSESEDDKLEAEEQEKEEVRPPKAEEEKGPASSKMPKAAKPTLSGPDPGWQLARSRNTSAASISSGVDDLEPLREARGAAMKWNLTHLPPGTSQLFTDKIAPLARIKAGRNEPWAGLSQDEVQEIIDEVLGKDESELVDDNDKIMDSKQDNADTSHHSRGEKGAPPSNGQNVNKQFRSAGTEHNTVAGQAQKGDRVTADNDDLNDVQLQRINDLVESFESEQYPKSEILLEILAVISGSACSSTIKSRTATEYIGVLDEIKFAQRAREERVGRTLTESVEQDRTQTAALTAAEDEGNEEMILDKRGVHGSMDMEIEIENLKTETLKKPTPTIFSNPSQSLRNETPLTIRKQEAKSLDHPYFHKTFQILEYMGQDLTEAKRFLTVAKAAPSGFPNTQWKRILAGQSVDLDIVHSSRHHIMSVGPDRGVSGSAESSSRPTDYSRSMTTQGEWSTAFKLYKRALLFCLHASRRRT
ncbi:hypothetical protein H0H93_005884 [Arthromyces matolae]|nr:hypothetical protein H0H93_005884 [Arthromyces matolae]